MLKRKFETPLEITRIFEWIIKIMYSNMSQLQI